MQQQVAKPTVEYKTQACVSASADHPDFKRPPGYFAGHSENYYRIGDCVSWGQKQFRRTNRRVLIKDDSGYALAMP